MKIMIAAPSSGSGKTTLTCALLALLKKKGREPFSFKCGPDYIDPMFHERILGIFSENLDSFFCTHEEIQTLFNRPFISGKSRTALIEGVMGLFDGLGGKSLTASSYDIARITGTPIMLVVDSTGMSRSLVPLVKGFVDYDKKLSGNQKNLIKTVFLNKCSKAQFELVKPQIETECGIKVAGYLPKDSEGVLKSRHLGLILPDEITNLRQQIDKTAQNLEESLDFSLLESLFSDEEELFQKLPEGSSSLSRVSLSSASCCTLSPALQRSGLSLTIAVARDEAFCFYYHDNLRMLEEAGAKLTFFSPLHDSCIPSDAQALLLGGGYPELHASCLQENSSMRQSIKSAVKNGITVMAECGGFMYLQEKLEGSGFSNKEEVQDLINEEGELSSYEMCGAIEGTSFYTGKLIRFGYADFFPKNWQPVAEPLREALTASSIKGHEFHYFDTTNNGSDFTARKPLSNRSWDCMLHTKKMLAGFPHLYYRSNPQLILSFLESCKKG